MSKSLAVIAALSAFIVLPSLASAMTDAECAGAWTKADANADGVITPAEGQMYFDAMTTANKPIADGKLTQAVFLENCKGGVFNTATTAAGAPLPGANSFTETQAKDRVAKAGFKDVSALKKDDKGVWRGTASDGSKNVNVSVDFKGNVVTN